MTVHLSLDLPTRDKPLLVERPSGDVISPPTDVVELGAVLIVASQLSVKQRKSMSHV